MTTDNLIIIHNEDVNRFEVQVDGHLAVLNYLRRDNTIIFTHTGVPDEISGRGIGSKLVRTGLDYARTEKLDVVPRCSFMAAYIKKHPAYQDLVHNE